jgi:hypothetical protein
MQDAATPPVESRSYPSPKTRASEAGSTTKDFPKQGVVIQVMAVLSLTLLSFYCGFYQVLISSLRAVS